VPDALYSGHNTTKLLIVAVLASATAHLPQKQVRYPKNFELMPNFSAFIDVLKDVPLALAKLLVGEMLQVTILPIFFPPLISKNNLMQWSV
jgi:hypothetical protein